MIPYEDLGPLNQKFRNELSQAFETIVDSGRYILGENVAAFEEEFAAYCGVSHCVGVGNGTDALILALRALELPPASEVILPSNAYIACVLAIINCGLTPVLVEPDEQTYTIDPNRIAEAITPKTAAIMVVHLYGRVCDMDAVVEVANRNALPVIEDCAQAHGAMYKGKRAGTFGTISAFSFFPTKNLGALGDGGGITTDSDKLNEKVRLLRFYGFSQRNYSECLGVNSRLDELQAAFLRIKLQRLDELNEHKRRLASIYDDNLISNFVRPVRSQDYHSVYHIYAVMHAERDRVRAYLAKHDIGTAVHYPIPPHRQPSLKSIFNGQTFPISERIHSMIISLPVSYIHNERDIHRVIEVINSFN